MGEVGWVCCVWGEVGLDAELPGKVELEVYLLILAR